MSNNWRIDPMKKDYALINGAPDQTDSLTIPAYIRMKVHRSKWLYAPDATYGSNFHAVQKRNSTEDASFLENMAADCLQPLLDDGRAREITVTTELVTRNNVGMKIEIVDANNQKQQIVLPQI